MPDCIDCQYCSITHQAEPTCLAGKVIVFPERYDRLFPGQEAFKGNGCKTFLLIYRGPRPTRFERILRDLFDSR